MLDENTFDLTGLLFPGDTTTMTSSTPPPTTRHEPVGDTTPGNTRLAGEPLDYDTNTDATTGTDAEAEAGVPVVFYATNTPGNPIAAAGAHARKNSWVFYQSLLPDLDDDDGPDPRKVDTTGVSYAAWVSVADVSASKSSGLEGCTRNAVCGCCSACTIERLPAGR
ncbi:hypothetical protein HMPREF1257_00003 [Corynebacterium sp. KPL1814]|nr:hypothetical protein HMPREF1257_00003 [Corynebacterium sp. KPL1814]